jgi:hypothetical protein
MCIMCDGASRDEARFSIHGKILRFGFSLMAVEGSPARPGWVYTIGLAAHGHPELVIVDLPIQTSASVLNTLGERVLRGERFTIGEIVPLGRSGSVTLSEVDRVHLERGLMDSWIDYYDALGEIPDLDVLQLVPSDDHYCGEHKGNQLRLDSPADSLRLGGNRSARRHPSNRRRRRR